MLPQIFRADDAVLEIALPAEHRQRLEQLLTSLSPEVFFSDDSLGWVYQFWQSQEKDRVNRSQKKIGPDELPAVTQLFTEDYMVEFLLHNTIGAWWAGKVLAQQPTLSQGAPNEDALRQACSLPGVDWRYLRFVRTSDRIWTPASGTFDTWPKPAKEIKVLDPCMGSGHFLVFALPLLAAIRSAEEGLSPERAIDAVLSENLYGLEIDQRCTQIAAFNLALTAWKRSRYHVLPRLHLACSGTTISGKEADWVALAGGDERQSAGMTALHRLFKQAAALGSLLNPKRVLGDMLSAGFSELEVPLDKAVSEEGSVAIDHELAVVASGVAKAATILNSHFTLVATNVPYLGRGRQDEVLREYCGRVHPLAKADLATCFLERGLEWASGGGSVALVTPHNWLFLGGYQKLREHLLRAVTWNGIVRLGEKGFDSPQAAGAFAALAILTAHRPTPDHVSYGQDVSACEDPSSKAANLRVCPVVGAVQSEQLLNPDARVIFGSSLSTHNALGLYAESYQGAVTGDLQRFVVCFWEVSDFTHTWEPFRTAIESSERDDGLTSAIRWQHGVGDLAQYAKDTRDQLHDMHESGQRAWGRRGVAINRMRELHATVFRGEKFDNNVAVVVPNDESHLPAILAFCSSPDFLKQVRALDQTLKVTNQTLRKVPFDLARWQSIAREVDLRRLAEMRSADATQWTFDGQPPGSSDPLQVATARLVGYCWPGQKALVLGDVGRGPDPLERYAASDGIVCLSALKGHESASIRLNAILAEAFGSDWSAQKLDELLGSVGYAGRTVDNWLRDGFFEQHCVAFHQRPFIWHIWDGLRDGFSALVNYHKLTKSNLENLTYAYVGDWIRRQEASASRGEAGSEARLVAAKQLQDELKKIIEGEPPYDLFVRWKPLADQPIGWQPDLNDGVRINIRPFLMAADVGRKDAGVLRVRPNIKWDKDRGKDPARPKEEFPWLWGWDGKTNNFAGGPHFDGNRWNDLHYSREIKIAARDKKGRV
jgi:hypothetical protein